MFSTHDVIHMSKRGREVNKKVGGERGGGGRMGGVEWSEQKGGRGRKKGG